MLKKEIRKVYLNKRKALPQAERPRLDDLLLIQLQKIALGNVSILFTYFPMEKMAEPDTVLFTRYLQFVYPDLQVAYPVTDLTNYTMKAHLAAEDSDLHENAYGLIEPQNNEIVPPSKIDICFVPLLAADNNGFRVGFGKGIYDKYLAQCRPEMLKIGFSYFKPITLIDDINKNDVPLDLLVTPEKVYHFK